MENYKKRIIKSFDNKAHSYEKYSVVQQEVSRRLIERIKLLKCSPQNILDIGSGTGNLSEQLKLNFKKSNIFCLDISEKMLNKCKSKNFDLSTICADTEFLPIKPFTFDLIISSFTFQWCKNLKKVFSDIKKLLTDKGVFIFSTVGPDTLIEVKNIFKEIDDDQHVNEFLDMHIIGDLLLSLNFSDPVMDVEKLTIEYKSFERLLAALRGTGTNIVISDEKKSKNKKIISKLKQIYKTKSEKDLFPVTYEVIYAIAWNNVIKIHKK